MAAQRLLVTEDAGRTQEVAMAFGASVGAAGPVLLAELPPWSTETELVRVARRLQLAGARCLVARLPSSPYAPAAPPDLAQLSRTCRAARICVGLTVTDAALAAAADGCVDLLVVSGCQMQDFSLLKALGRLQTAILLERGPAVTEDEWLMSAEYILSGGNRRVILCAGPSRRSDGAAGWTVDLPGALAVQGRTHLPVLVDLTRLDPVLVAPMARAAAAAGLHGVLAAASAADDAAGALELVSRRRRPLTTPKELTVY